MSRDSNTPKRLLDAAETVIREADSFSDVTARRIASEAETTLSSISYHFGSLEDLAIETAMRIYRRLNVLRLTELQAAVDRTRPGPPMIEDVVAALIGPSIRWSLDPESPYPVLTYLNRLSLMSDHPERFRGIVESVEHHRTFIRYLARAAPWFDETEIAWRLNAALGIRSQLTRARSRTDVLIGREMHQGDTDEVIASTVELIVTMFAKPSRPRDHRTVSDKRHEAVTDLA